MFLRDAPRAFSHTVMNPHATPCPPMAPPDISFTSHDARYASGGGCTWELTAEYAETGAATDFTLKIDISLTVLWHHSWCV